MRFAGKRAVVTGASRGIGRAVARALVDEGARVGLVARSGQAPAEWQADIGAGRAVWLAEDVTRPGAPERILAACAERFGGVELLVNAAGGARVATALGIPEEAWRADFELKFFGYARMMRAAAPYLRQRGGVMVNIVGVAGKDPNPTLATASAVNAALRAFVKVLADELASDHVRVVNVDPGACETGLLAEMAEGLARLYGGTPEDQAAAMRRRGGFGRLPTPEEVARLVLFLLSDEAAMVTGTSIDIDGGVHRGLA
ncbi:MAG: SDR family oxidoreductase [Actinomycetia bacterium]|nr:SDR family oxidoreductase [Actinomycetes bacterium]